MLLEAELRSGHELAVRDAAGKLEVRCDAELPCDEPTTGNGGGDVAEEGVGAWTPTVRTIEKGRGRFVLLVRYG